MKPVRIQLRRSKGWRMPPNTVKVCRPGPWGNPYLVGTVGTETNELAVRAFRSGLAAAMQGDYWAGPDVSWIARNIMKLRGKNLACWCPPGEPCHADVLLEIANA
ncbi:MAG: DUF4326 domain-containing protein [bacterium]